MDMSIFISSEGMEKLQRRIATLMNEERPKMLQTLVTAREFGDLSENAEYKAARESQRSIDSEIDYLRRRGAQLKVIDISTLPKDKVSFGAYCLAIDTETQEEILYRVVGVEELNFMSEDGVMTVSVVSPIGKALLGKKIGEVAAVQAPMGIRSLEIKEIR